MLLILGKTAYRERKGTLLIVEYVPAYLHISSHLKLAAAQRVRCDHLHVKDKQTEANRV